MNTPQTVTTAGNKNFKGHIGLCEGCLSIGHGEKCTDCGAELIHHGHVIGGSPDNSATQTPSTQPIMRISITLDDTAPVTGDTKPSGAKVEKAGASRSRMKAGFKPIVIAPVLTALVAGSAFGIWTLVHENDRSSARQAVARTVASMKVVTSGARKARTTADWRKVGQNAKTGTGVATEGLVAVRQVDDAGFKRDATRLLRSYSKVLAGYAPLAKFDGTHASSHAIRSVERSAFATASLAGEVSASLAAAQRTGIAPTKSSTGAQVRAAAVAARQSLGDAAARISDYEAAVRQFNDDRARAISVTNGYFASAIQVANDYDKARSDLDSKRREWDSQVSTPTKDVTDFLGGAASDRDSLAGRINQLTSPSGYSAGASGLADAINNGATAINQLLPAIDSVTCSGECEGYWDALKATPEWTDYERTSDENGNRLAAARTSLSNEHQGRLDDINAWKAPSRPHV